jgi:hypothetical protein
MEQDKHIIEGQIFRADVQTEDGGQAKIVTLAQHPEDENGMFVKIQSWDETLKHEEFEKFVGRKVKVTIEAID